MRHPIAAACALLLAGALWLAGAGIAHAAATVTMPVEFPSCMNTSASLFAAPPVGITAGNTGTNLAGIRFDMIDPAKADNMWVGSAGGSLRLAVSVPAPQNAYMLLNTFYGQGGVRNVTVVFKGTNNTRRQFSLTGNATIRDYNNWTWTDTINNSTTQEWWTNNPNPSPQDQSHRLDVHNFAFGTTFAGQMLTEIVVTAPANAGVNYMQPVLSGIALRVAPAAGQGKTIPSTCKLVTP